MTSQDDGAGTGSEFERISTGRPELDAILSGGFPADSINIVMGQPGTGKTVFAQQILFHNATPDRPALYLTTLSEPLPKIVRYLQNFSFFDPDRIGEAVVYDDLGEALGTEGLDVLMPRLREAIRTMSPRFIAIDSFRALHDLGASVAETRRIVSEMAGLLSAYRTTSLLVGEYTEDQVVRFPEFAVGDSIIQLARLGNHRRDSRYLRVLKLRGSGYAEGAHAFEIREHGIDVYPRLVTPRLPDEYAPGQERVATGVNGLDALLAGGLWRGSNTLVVGPAGSGKTTLALQFALEGARRGERCLVLNLQENPTQLARTMQSLRVVEDGLGSDRLQLSYHSPVELQIDRVANDIVERVRRRHLDRIVIDSLGDLALAADDPERFHDFLYALVQHLIVRGVTSVMTLERRSDTGVEPRVSSIADAVIELKVDLAQGARRLLRVAKARGSAHELRWHTMRIGAGGITVEEEA